MTKMNINDSNLYFFNCLSRMFKHLQDLIGILRLRDTSELLSAMLPCFPGSHLQIEFATEKMKVLKRHFVPFFLILIVDFHLDLVSIKIKVTDYLSSSLLIIKTNLFTKFICHFSIEIQYSLSIEH